MSTALVRVFWSLLVHTGWLVFILVILYLLAGDETALAEATRSQYIDNPVVLEQIREDVRWKLILWGMLSIVASWVLSGIWLFIAEKQRPRTPQEGASKKGLWSLLLFATIAVMAILGWTRLWSTSVLVDLTLSTTGISALVVVAFVGLAYFTATGIAVKPVMRPSVPFSSILPKARSKA